ncbi:glycoside hydrolase family 38 C-terminal domain-containing protein [Martelella sp. HB161492]|uniref:alpha-mannosidase n=1 Tax=Martelella sp. HB161492 TaxID=2720726 RepID=UPI001FEEFD54|nr:glycoside hydrolase family 38 C-terminal domain-containing protein [Martelella sp. HB161492]
MFREGKLAQFSKVAHLLDVLAQRIFTTTEHSVAFQFAEAVPEQRDHMLAGPHADWTAVTRDTVWGEPQRYFWFAGRVSVPAALAGKRLYLGIEAAFGRVMGRSDPQCLVRINGRIAQGADYNHREILLTETAQAGDCFDIMIEAGTIEDRRQLGFGARLLVHDLAAEALYYDLRTPLDVAKHLDQNDHRRDFLLKSIYEALNAVDLRPGDPARFAASLERASVIAARIYAARDSDIAPRITVTGHTHIDVAWLWRVRETRQKMARSMATALALMAQYPEYRFMYNQGLLLDYLEQDYPALFDEISARQKDGQFEIEGALWLEPDANMTGGESLVRHILRGVRYHGEKFGVRPHVLWLPDTFGYSAAFPQLMKLSGLDVFVTHKMSWNDTNRMPNETFFWQGIDGSQAPTYFLTTQPMESTSIGTTYCPDLKASHVMGTWKRYAQKETNDELFLVYGFGDGGGGPTREMLEHIRRMERGIPGCPKVEQGFMGPVLNRIVERIRQSPSDYPVWVGELYLEFHRGTFTSVGEVKRNNRRAEATLRELEVLATLAWRGGVADYPAEALSALWDIALLNQFHDILPGSSIGLVYEDSARDYAAFFADAAVLRQGLAERLAGGDTVLVVNPFAQATGGLVRLPGSGPQMLADKASQTVYCADGTKAEAAPVAPVPGLSASRLPVGPAPAPASGSGGLKVAPDRLENAHLLARFDASGRLCCLIDKASGRDALVAGMTGNRLQAYRDLPAEYDAWDIDRTFEDQLFEIDGLVEAEVVERGPYRAAIRFEWRYESSTLVQIVALEADDDVLQFDSFIDWHEKNTLVKAAFPLEIAAAETEAEIQFGHVSRPSHANTSWDVARFECPMQRWVSMSEPGFGAAFLTDSKYGYDARGTTLRLTLLRSPTWPFDGADQGVHRFRYGIMLHRGIAASQIPARAEAFNQPLTAIGGLGPGTKVDLSAPISVDNPAIAIEAMKRAEDSEAVIIRLWERHGARQQAVLALGADIATVHETDLLEEQARALPLEGGRVQLSFRPFEIKTIALRGRKGD